MDFEHPQKAQWDDLLLRVRRGFELRLRQAQNVKRRLKSSPADQDIIRVINAIPFDGYHRSREAADYRFFQVSATINNARFRLQQAIVSTVSDATDVGIVAALALGYLRNEHGFDLVETYQLPDEEFSIVIESFCRFGRISSDLPDNVVDQVVEISRGFIKSILSTFSILNKSGYVSLERDPIAQNALEIFSEFKRRALGYAGPDIASAFQFLAEPALSPSSDELKAMRSLAIDWGLEAAFDSLLFARIMQPRDVERVFVRENFGTLVQGRRASLELASDLKRIVGDDTAPRFTTRRRMISRLHRQVYLAARLSVALDRGDRSEIYATVIDIFCFDRGLVKFLDWARITAAVRRSYDVTVESAFVTMLLNEPDVKANHAKAALSMGKGAFIGDITALLRVGGQQKEDLGKILGYIKNLPGPAAQAMTQAVLSRDIVERLAAALVRRSSQRRPGLSSGDSVYISFLRVAALKDAASRSLLPRAVVTTEVDSEIQQVRYNYFQARMRVGRVRVPWSDIKSAAKRILEETAPIGLLKTLAAKDAAEEVIPRLVQFIAEKLNTYILYDGPVSIDHALSDNLRHGIVLPRFLKTFDDALQTISRRHALAGWESDQLRSIFSVNSEAILSFRDFVSDRVKAFVDGDLVVQPKGELHNSVLTGITSALDVYFRSEVKKRSIKPETRVARVAERCVRSALKDAGRKLSDDIRRKIMTELRALRADCKKTGHTQTKEFLDCLETNLHGAIEEVRQWIGVADQTGDVIPFTLKDVVDLELLTTQFNVLKRLKVKVDQELTKADGQTIENFAIQGKYLAAFESIVHNLMSNAFKYSGAGLQSDVSFQLKLNSNKLFVRAENKISATNVADVIKNYSRTVALARKMIGPEVRQDKQSGFQKIRSALTREFSADPTINIPPPSERNRLFVVEIGLDLRGEIWIER